MYSADKQAEKTDNINACTIMVKLTWDASFFLAYLGEESSGHSEKVAPAVLKFIC